MAVGILMRSARCRRKWFAVAFFYRRRLVRLRLQSLGFLTRGLAQPPSGRERSDRPRFAVRFGVGGRCFISSSSFSLRGPRAGLREQRCRHKRHACRNAPRRLLSPALRWRFGHSARIKEVGGERPPLCCGPRVRRASPAARDRCQAAIGAASSESAKR